MNKKILVIIGIIGLGSAGLLAILRTGPVATGDHTEEHEDEDEHRHDEAADSGRGDDEGRPRVQIAAGVAQAAGIVTAQAGPALIQEALLLYGTVIPDERRVRAIGARFPGVAREVRRTLGERVAADETLVLVESNESLQTYPVRSPIAGVVIGRNVNPGENVGDEPVFTVADLSTVVAELAVFRRDLARLRVGQSASVRADGDEITGRGTVTFISPVGSGESQSIGLRVALDNRDGRWQPGIFVTAEVEVSATEVPVAVTRAALQRLGDDDVVFASSGDFYEPRTVEVGRADRERVQIRAGLAAGDTYVSENSFLVKADLGKSAAGHEH